MNKLSNFKRVLDISRKLDKLGVQFEIDEDPICGAYSPGERFEVYAFDGSVRFMIDGNLVKRDDTVYTINKLYTNKFAVLEEFIRTMEMIGACLINDISHSIDWSIREIKPISREQFYTRWQKMFDWAYARGYRNSMSEADFEKWKKRLPRKNFLALAAREILLGMHIPKQCLRCKNMKINHNGVAICDSAQRFYYNTEVDKFTGSIIYPDKLRAGFIELIGCNTRVLSNVIADNTDNSTGMIRWTTTDSGSRIFQQFANLLGISKHSIHNLDCPFCNKRAKKLF